MKLCICVRNITKETDHLLMLPTTNDEIERIMNAYDEYIIVDSGWLDVSEYEKVKGLNQFILDCKKRISKKKHYRHL